MTEPVNGAYAAGAVCMCGFIRSLMTATTKESWNRAEILIFLDEVRAIPLIAAETWIAFDQEEAGGDVCA